MMILSRCGLRYNKKKNERCQHGNVIRAPHVTGLYTHVHVIRGQHDRHKKNKYFSERTNSPWRAVFSDHTESLKGMTHQAVDYKEIIHYFILYPS